MAEVRDAAEGGKVSDETKIPEFGYATSEKANLEVMQAIAPGAGQSWSAPKRENREAEELLNQYLAYLTSTDRARIVSLIAKGLEAETMAHDIKMLDAQLDLAKKANDICQAQPTREDTAKCPPHRPVGGGEYGSSFHGDIICGDCGKDLSDEPATGAVANESPVTASAKCPKCGIAMPVEEVWTIGEDPESIDYHAVRCANGHETKLPVHLSLADFAQFFTGASNRLPKEGK